MKMKVAPSAAAKVNSLPPDVISKVDSKLVAGESGALVAQWLQDSGYLKEMLVGTLKKALERYRGGALRNKVFKQMTEAQKGLTIKTVEQRLNAIDEMEELVRIQRARVDKMLLVENGKPIILKSASEEIRLLKDMLLDLGRCQLETGTIPRASRTIRGQMTDETGEVTKFEWTEEQEELFRELESVNLVEEETAA